MRTVSDYLGDEIVLAVPVSGGKLQSPVMVAEQKKRGLKEYLSGSTNGVSVEEQGDLVVMGGRTGRRI